MTPFPWLSTLGGSLLSDHCGLNQLPSAQAGLGWRRMKEGSDDADREAGGGGEMRKGQGMGKSGRTPLPSGLPPRDKTQMASEGHSPSSFTGVSPQ